MAKKSPDPDFIRTGPCKQRVKGFITNPNLTKIPDDQILPMDLHPLFWLTFYPAYAGVWPIYYPTTSH